MVHVFGERDVNGVITVWWTVKHAYIHEVGVEVFQGVWGSEGSAWRVRNRVFDEESNFTTRTRLGSVILEEGVTRERY